MNFDNIYRRFPFILGRRSRPSLRSVSSLANCPVASLIVRPSLPTFRWFNTCWVWRRRKTPCSPSQKSSIDFSRSISSFSSRASTSGFFVWWWWYGWIWCCWWTSSSLGVYKPWQYDLWRDSSFTREDWICKQRSHPWINQFFPQNA